MQEVYKEAEPESTADSENSADHVQALYQLLGSKVVLLHIEKHSKFPPAKAWQKTTFADTQEPSYRSLLASGNVGVLLGRASGNLITIDWDTDDLLQEFRAKNPDLNTLISKRVRGGNVWLYMAGPYPTPSSKLTLKEKAVGEWRADRNQTVIWGEATDRKHGEIVPTAYKILNRVPPATVQYEQIVWPEGVERKEPKAQTPPLQSSTSSVRLYDLYTYEPISTICLYDKPERSVLENVRAKNQAEKVLESQFPLLQSLFAKLIEPKFKAIASGRNTFIVSAVPFLYRAVCPQVALDMIGIFYMKNRAIFHDSLATHQNEAQAMLKGVQESYERDLPKAEFEIYAELNERERVAFRICRDLAYHKKGKDEALSFFIGKGHLAERMGFLPGSLKANMASRVLDNLIGCGIVKLLEKGEPWSEGKKPKAGGYLWLLPRAEEKLPAPEI